MTDLNLRRAGLAGEDFGVDAFDFGDVAGVGAEGGALVDLAGGGDGDFALDQTGDAGGEFFLGAAGEEEAL